MAKDKTGVGWEISTDVQEKFKAYCDSVNSRYGDATAAAMIIWQYLPPTIQRLAQLEANGIPSIDRKFWDDFASGINQATLEQARTQTGKKRNK